MIHASSVQNEIYIIKLQFDSFHFTDWIINGEGYGKEHEKITRDRYSSAL